MHATLPPEIWLRIWYLCSKEDLRSLISVCRYFKDLWHPLLFRHQRLTALPDSYVSHLNWMTTTRRLHRANMSLRELAASCYVDSVRAWEFCGRMELSGLPGMYPNVLHVHLVPETYEKAVQRFTSTLGAYRNLRSMHVSRFVLDSAFRDALSSLGHLESLHMIDWLRSLTTIPRTIPSTLCPQKHCAPDNLVDLKIRLSDRLTDRSVAIAFLERCPHVAHIEISHPSTLSGTLPVRLPHAAIPNVASFKVPTSLGGLITLDRPATAVVFSSAYASPRNPNRYRCGRLRCDYESLPGAA
ncbi:hypothetical protein FB451DRAFT_1483477 [Mycena latifolia]|nr:hypothetical protein FB451DRAFT_1483477 [Mycena latifolia]